MAETHGRAAAMRFIRAAREDEALAEKLRALDPAEGLEPVIALAHEAGFDVTVDDLRAAHGHDWGLRRALYAREATDDSAQSTVADGNSASSST
jgi:predicted ribosomally synthesized peptide with nif11-like leader